MSREDLYPLEWEYKDRVEQFGNLRPVHRYSRYERFKKVLFQICCLRGEVGEEVLREIKMMEFDPRTIWEDIRRWLKVNGVRKYDLIPLIIWECWGVGVLESDELFVVDDILKAFKVMNLNFESGDGRVYFPNIRFIVLRFLELNGVEFKYLVPMIRTRKKYELMDGLFNKFY